MHRFRGLRAVGAIAVAALSCLATPASAQYYNTLNGRQFSNMYAANADFLMSQMIQQSGWAAMRAAVQATANRQQAAATAGAAKKVVAPKAPAYAKPITATDFKPAGVRNVPEQLSAAVADPKDRAGLVKAGREIIKTIEATPGFRKNNLAAAMAVLLGVSVQVRHGADISDAESEAFMRGLNDVLASTPAFATLGAEQRTRTYDTFIVVGGLIAGIAQVGIETGNADLVRQAKDMAGDALAQFGIKG